MTTSDFKQHTNTLVNIFGKEKSFLKICLATKKYFKANNIKEISVNKFSEISGFERDLCQKILIKLNSDLFVK